jgi:hypothetical protein
VERSVKPLKGGGTQGCRSRSNVDEGGCTPDQYEKHVCIAAWTFAAMPSSVLLAVPFMGLNALVGDSTVASAVVGFGFHVLASAANVAGIAVVHKYATRNRQRRG